MSKKKKTVKTKSKSSYEILKVFWEDHFSGNRHWVQDVKELRTDPLICTSVGFKVHENKKTITLAQNMGEGHSIADTTTIIKSCIIKREKLGEVEYGVREES